MVSARNEMAALRLLSSYVVKIQNGFSSTWEDDVTALQEGKNSMSQNLQNVVRLHEGSKFVIRRTIELVSSKDRVPCCRRTSNCSKT